jgi:hypothetical protein
LGGRRSPGLGAVGVGAPAAPVLPNKNGPCSKGPFNPKSARFLSTHCEISHRLPAGIMRDPTVATACSRKRQHIQCKNSCLVTTIFSHFRSLNLLFHMVVPIGPRNIRLNSGLWTFLFFTIARSSLVERLWP